MAISCVTSTQAIMRPTMTGKTVLITGASAGIGKATAAELAARGAHLVLACRDLEKADRARAEIAARAPGATIDLVPLELASLRSVRACAEKVCAGYARIDVLINNAGVFPPVWAPTASRRRSA
jgi:NAD(P)-dependent dehydrogenase (short-subunit alcohol dehydrogenase family)